MTPLQLGQMRVHKVHEMDSPVPLLSQLPGTTADDLARLRQWYEQPDEITDRPERFLAAELVRERIFRLLGDELPYSIAVDVEQFEQEGNLRRISAAIYVDKPSHRAIVIGAKTDGALTARTVVVVPAGGATPQVTG